MNPFLNLDGDILIYIQDHIRNSFLDVIFPNITFLGDAGILWIALTVIFMFFKQTRKAAICSAIALLGSVILNNLLIKPLVGRVRPYEVVEGLKLMGKAATDPSFPSGHSAASFASAVAMFPHLPKKAGIPLLVIAAMIAFSRLYIGIHYPTDVLFGIVDGILLGILAVFIGNIIFKKIDEKKAAKEA